MMQKSIESFDTKSEKNNYVNYNDIRTSLQFNTLLSPKHEPIMEADIVDEL